MADPKLEQCFRRAWWVLPAASSCCVGTLWVSSWHSMLFFLTTKAKNEIGNADILEKILPGSKTRCPPPRLSWGYNLFLLLTFIYLPVSPPDRPRSPWWSNSIKALSWLILTVNSIILQQLKTSAECVCESISSIDWEVQNSNERGMTCLDTGGTMPKARGPVR